MDYPRMLSRLCAIPAPSGFEEPMARCAAELLRPLLDEVQVNRMGCVVGVRRCGIEGAHRLLLDAHLDEVGFLVTGHEEGFLRLAGLGGADARVLADREMTVLTDPPLSGIIACLPPHVETREDMDQELEVSRMFLDVGLTQEQATARIPIGTPVVCKGDCFRLGEKMFCGRALDDRAGFAVILDALERLQGETLDVDLYVLGSTQEEFEEVGAITGAFGVAPDLCVAIDVTHGRSPDAPKEQTSVMGGGPVINLGPNATPWMNRRLRALAKDLGQTLQTEVNPRSSGTNAWPIQVSREGVATAVLYVPLRYMHTPSEVVHLDDLEAAGSLVAAFVKGIGKEVPAYA